MTEDIVQQNILGFDHFVEEWYENWALVGCYINKKLWVIAWEMWVYRNGVEHDFQSAYEVFKSI